MIARAEPYYAIRVEHREDKGNAYSRAYLPLGSEAFSAEGKHDAQAVRALARYVAKHSSGVIPWPTIGVLIEVPDASTWASGSGVTLPDAILQAAEELERRGAGQLEE
jgi:hypothetical protein